MNLPLYTIYISVKIWSHFALCRVSSTSWPPTSKSVSLIPLPSSYSFSLFSRYFSPSSAHSLSLPQSLYHPPALHTVYPSPIFSIRFLPSPASCSHCNLILASCSNPLVGSPSSSTSPSTGNEVKLFNGILPFSCKCKPPGTMSTKSPCSHDYSGSWHIAPSHSSGPASTQLTWHRRRIALLFSPRGRVRVHLDHVVTVERRRGANILLRLSFLVANAGQGGHLSASPSRCVVAHSQTHPASVVLNLTFLLL